MAPRTRRHIDWSIQGREVSDGPIVDGDSLVYRETSRVFEFEPGATSESLGLGKYVAAGYNDLPTWIDPASTDWADNVANDRGFVQFAFGLTGDAIDVYVSKGDGTSAIDAAITTSGGVFLAAYSALGSSALTDGGFESNYFSVDQDGKLSGSTPATGDAAIWTGSYWGPFDPKNIPIHEIDNTDHTLALVDKGCLLGMQTGGAPRTVSVPSNANVPFPVGSWTEVWRAAADPVLLAPGPGAALYGSAAGYHLRTQDSVARVVKVSQDAWLATGDLAA